jgi:hypothetical protein
MFVTYRLLARSTMGFSFLNVGKPLLALTLGGGQEEERSDTAASTRHDSLHIIDPYLSARSSCSAIVARKLKCDGILSSRGICREARSKVRACTTVCLYTETGTVRGRSIAPGGSRSQREESPRMSGVAWEEAARPADAPGAPRARLRAGQRGQTQVCCQARCQAGCQKRLTYNRPTCNTTDARAWRASVVFGAGVAADACIAGPASVSLADVAGGTTTVG